MKTGIARFILTVLAAALFTGCSSFNRQWRAAVKQPRPAETMAGPWEGRWISDANGHNDKLRCIITQKSTNQFDANFHATYKSVFHFSYVVPLEAKRDGDHFTFSGEADLGKLAGGVYSYNGVATPTNFFSTYQSKYDHGKFEMHRP